MGRLELKSKTKMNSLFLLIALIILYSCNTFRPDRLMSWDDYICQPRNAPYVLELDSGRGRLIYYGAFHKVDPAHPQFEDIEQKWEKFQPTLAYCEGNIWPLEESRAMAIRKHGEQGLLTYLAARDGIPIACIDPPLVDQAKFLRTYFAPHFIKIYYVLRQAAVNRMLKKDRHDLRYVSRLLRSFSRINSYNIFPANMVEFENMVCTLFPDLDGWQDIPFSYFHNPNTGGFLFSIHRKLNEYRDQIMIRKVIAALKKGYRVFVVVGRSHVVIQEAILRSAS